MLPINKNCFVLIIIIFVSISCNSNKDTTAIPEKSNQLVLVVSDSTSATKAKLFTFERNNNTNWKLHSNNTPVVLGRNGLGLGKGLHKQSELVGIPEKIEGDGRSPAGIFKLSSVFGYLPKEKFQNLKMPYIQISKLVECVDDPNSKYYNRFLSRDTVSNPKEIDWTSSEKMSDGGIYYELGVIVVHNCCPKSNASGSCIFLHNWADSNETTAGCTAMEPSKMREIILWLDETKNPILVQLPHKAYIDNLDLWKLPLLDY